MTSKNYYGLKLCPVLFAEKLVNPAFSFEGEGFLKRSNSNTSLNSLVSVEGEQHMRVCQDCRQLLERRDIMAEQRNTKPPIVQLYDVWIFFPYFKTSLI